MPLTSVELCAGAGGQAIGLDQAGFEHRALVEVDPHCRATLKANRQDWNVLEGEQCDLHHFCGTPYHGVDLVAAGLPCPPFSKAGKQLGADDERNLFPAALRIISEIQPRAVLIENVTGILDPKFKDFRQSIVRRLQRLGYRCEPWHLLNASEFGVPQLRPRVNLVAFRKDLVPNFVWPTPNQDPAPTVGDALFQMMFADGWEGAFAWRAKADKIAPTIVGGSKKHGGPDLGPTRAKRAWAALGVNGHLVANAPPQAGFTGAPCLTVDMVARLQGFPSDWKFSGKKTAAYRQVGNAFPPPVARAVGEQIALSLALPLIARQTAT